MMKTEEYYSRQEAVHSLTFNVTTYKVEDRFYCRVDHGHLGSAIAFGEGNSRGEAEQDALNEVRAQLSSTV